MEFPDTGGFPKGLQKNNPLKMANVKLKYTGKEDTRVRAFHGKDKIAVGVGEVFESDLATAAKLVKDHGKLFVYADDFVEAEKKTTKVEDPRTNDQLKAELKAKGFDEKVYSRFGKAALLELLHAAPPVPEEPEVVEETTDEQSGEPEEVVVEELEGMPEPKGGAEQKTA